MYIIPTILLETKKELFRGSARLFNVRAALLDCAFQVLMQRDAYFVELFMIYDFKTSL